MTIAFAIPDHTSRGSKDWRATPKSSERSALATTAHRGLADTFVLTTTQMSASAHRSETFPTPGLGGSGPACTTPRQ